MTDAKRRWIRGALISIGTGIGIFVGVLDVASTNGGPLTILAWVKAIALGVASICTTGGGFLSQSPRES